MRSPTSRPRRVSLRSRARGSSIHTAIRRIQERDIRIFFDLMEHRVLTTGQIVELHFSSYRIGSRRARLLHEMGFLARFRPSKSAGSAPWHYALDEPGAFVVATRLDRDLKDTPYRRQDVDRIAASEHLEHLVQTNGFFTRLAWACRQDGQATLREWRGERRSGRGWGVRVQPDGVGRVSSNRGETWFFFELDRGTESHERLRAKLRRYARSPRCPAFRKWSCSPSRASGGRQRRADHCSRQTSPLPPLPFPKRWQTHSAPFGSHWGVLSGSVFSSSAAKRPRRITLVRRRSEGRNGLEPLVTVEEAAAFLGVQPGTVYLWAETGQLPSYKIGNLRRFRLSELETHLHALREGPERPQARSRSVVGGIIPSTEV